MLYTDALNCPHYAPVDKFDMLRGQVLAGRRLNEIDTLQRSISRFGLLSPIIAIQRAGRLIVVDGRKRLSAIRRLAFQGLLPRSLAHVPYRLVKDMRAAGRQSPPLVASQALYAAVTQCHADGVSLDDIAAQFQVSRQCVRDVLTLSRLHPRLRKAFYARLIDFAQAQAYATLPDIKEQRRRFRALGPFAAPSTISAGTEATARASDAHAIAA